MEMVWLKNRSQEPKVAVDAAMKAMRALQQQELSGHLALIELVEMAEDPYRKPSLATGRILLEHGLIKENGYMSSTVRNAVFISKA